MIRHLVFLLMIYLYGEKIMKDKIGVLLLVVLNVSYTVVIILYKMGIKFTLLDLNLSNDVKMGLGGFVVYFLTYYCSKTELDMKEINKTTHYAIVFAGLCSLVACCFAVLN